MNKVYDIIIIGAGPAGMMSALYAKRSKKDVLILDKFQPGGRLKTTYQVDNYLGFGKVSAQELVSKMVSHLHDLDIQECYGTVTDIQKNGATFCVHTDDEILCARAVIVASGTSPKPLGVKNEKELLSRGISYCAVCDGMFFENEDVVMVGGGDSALEESMYLSDICASVTIIHDLKELTASKSIQDRVLNKDNIRILYEREVVEFIGKEELEGILLLNKTTNEKEILKTSGAFIYCGNQADTPFLSTILGKTENGFVEVNSEMKTKVDGLFACGDVTKKDYRFIVTAISDGAIAALSAVKYLEQK